MGLAVRRRPRTVSLLLVSVLLAAAAAALGQPANSPALTTTGGGGQPQAQAPTEALVTIEMETSRAQLMAGEGIGVAAEITNASSQPVKLTETSVTLTVPPEMSGANDTRTWFAYFPTEHPPTSASPSTPGQAKTEEFSELILQPKNTYQVFWTPIEARPHRLDAKASTWTRMGNTLENVAEQVVTDLGFLFFTPGDYKLTAQAKYWLITADAGTFGTYRTVQKSAVVHIAAPQLVIIIGAILGGLIAYFLLPRSRREEEQTVTAVGPGTTRIESFVVRVFRRTHGVFGACLLSAIVTILLARISETQFLVKVTVNDIWGAITIGFFANYAGSKVLERFFGQSERHGTVVGQGETTQAHVESHVQNPVDEGTEVPEPGDGV